MLVRPWFARSAVLGLPLTLAVLATLGWACSSSNDGGSGGSGGTSSSSGSGADPTVSTSQCTTSCQQKATACQAPAAIASQQCSSICGGGVTQSQLACLSSTSCEDLQAISDSPSLESVCPKGSGGTSSGGTSGTISSPGKFGAKCKCESDSSQGAGEFECKGTTICSEGLSCIGSRTQGVDDGTCRGPQCCSGEADCAAKLGKQSNCAAGQKCACTRGDLECVGDKCTCRSGVAGTSGLCYPN